MDRFRPLENLLEVLEYADAPGLQRAAASPRASRVTPVWRDMRSKCNIDACYFEARVPLVAFTHADERHEIEDRRHRLWNYNRVPILIGTTSTEAIAYSCFDGPMRQDGSDHRPLVACDILSVEQRLSDFRRKEIGYGAALRKHPAQFRQANRVDARLLKNLRVLRNSFDSTDATRATLDALIGRTIFVRYLEDRRLLPPHRLEGATGESTLVDVLRAGRAVTIAMFEMLAEALNGDLFRNQASKLGGVAGGDLELIASFLSGDDLSTRQASFWPYDFSIIPPELLGYVYEQLLEHKQKEDAVYYTPRRVVDLVLDQVIPIGLPDDVGSLASPPRILDPACGSGIFLNEAFRRLIYQAMSPYGDRPSYEALCGLLTKSIFGVDKSPIAVEVAALGLCLTLLEHADVEGMWDTWQLPGLIGTNLVVSDFFKPHELSDASFDAVVGNPPWASQLPDSAADFLSSRDLQAPDKQLAIAFLYASSEQLDEGKTICMVLPSKSMLHNRSGPAERARSAVFERLSVQSVVDLAALRQGLFQSANAPAAIITAITHSRRIQSGTEGQIVHVAPKPSPHLASLDAFVVANVDIQSLDYGNANNWDGIWKTLLWGTKADLELVGGLRALFPNLGEIAVQRGWLAQRGFQRGGGDAKDATELQQYSEATIDAVRPLHFDPQHIVEFNDAVLHRPRNPDLFRAPHVLIRRGILQGEIASVFTSEDLAHNDSIIGIAGKAADETQLRLLSAYISSSVGRYYHYMTCSSWGVERNYIELNEHLSLPIPPVTDDLERRILDAIDEASSLAMQGNPQWRHTIDVPVFDAYELSDSDRARVVQSLDSILEQSTASIKSDLLAYAATGQLQDYCRTLEEGIAALVTSLSVTTSYSLHDSYIIVTVAFREPLTQSTRSRDWNALETRIPSRQRDTLIAQVEEEAASWRSTTLLQLCAFVPDGRDVHIVKPSGARYWQTVSAREDAASVIGLAITPQVEDSEPR